MTEKVCVAKATANVSLPVTEFSTRDGDYFVRFRIQVGVEATKPGSYLHIYDHRQKTCQAVQEHSMVRTNTAKRGALEHLRRVVNTPARVVVMCKFEDGREKYYVNLFPTDQPPKALFVAHQYVIDSVNSFLVLRNESIWSWTSQAVSRLNRTVETCLLTLTDREHCCMFERSGNENLRGLPATHVILSHRTQFFTASEFKKR